MHKIKNTLKNIPIYVFQGLYALIVVLAASGIVYLLWLIGKGLFYFLKDILTAVCGGI